MSRVSPPQSGSQNNKFLVVKSDILKKYVPKGQFFMKMTKNDAFFEKLSKKERATATTAATAAEEFSQSIQAPSSTHPGTTYPVRAIPHSDYFS